MFYATDKTVFANQFPKNLFSKYSRSKIINRSPNFRVSPSKSLKTLPKKSIAGCREQACMFGVSRNYAHGDLFAKNTIYCELSVLT